MTENIIGEGVRRRAEAEIFHSQVSEAEREDANALETERVEQWIAEASEGSVRGEVTEGDKTFIVETRKDGSVILFGHRGDPRGFRPSIGIQIGSIAGEEDGLAASREDEGGAEGVVMTADAGSVLGGVEQVLGAPFAGLSRGVAKAGLNTAKAVADVVGATDVSESLGRGLKALDVMAAEDVVPPPVAVIGKISEVIGQLVLPASLGARTIQMTGRSRVFSAAVADLMTGFLAEDPDAPSTAGMILNAIEAEGPAADAIRALMEVDPDDNEFEKRAKQAANVLAELGVAEIGIRAVVGSIKGITQVVKTIGPERMTDTALLVGGGVSAMTSEEAAAASEPGSVQIASAGGKIVDLLLNARKPLGVAPGEPILSRAAKEKFNDALINGAPSPLKGIDFNLDRMATGNEMDALINEISVEYKAAIDAGKGGKQSFKETQSKADLARLTGFDIEDVLTRQSGELWPAHKIKAARDLFVSQLSKAEEMARAIKAGADTTENQIRFRRQLAIVAGIQSQLKGNQTEVARALGQYRMVARTDMARTIEFGELYDATGGERVHKLTVDAFIDVIENGNASAAASFARDAHRTTTTDILFSNWINALLGSPTTHMANVIGGVGTLAYKQSELAFAASYGTLRRALTGDTAGVSFLEVMASWEGMTLGFVDGVVAFSKALRTGDGTDIFNKVQRRQTMTAENLRGIVGRSALPQPIKDKVLREGGMAARAIDFLGAYYFELPTRFLQAEDEFFKATAYRMGLQRFAAREAFEAGRGLKGYRERWAEILADPAMEAPQLHKSAVDEAREVTFTMPPGPATQNIQRAARALPGGRYVATFMSVMSNIMRFAGRRVPGIQDITTDHMGSSRFSLFSKLRNATPAERDIMIGQYATTAMLMGYAAHLSAEGRLTGRITDNRRLKAILRDQGITENSLIVGDQSIDLSRFEPVSVFLIQAASMQQAIANASTDEEREALFSAGLNALSAYMKDKTFFRSFAEFIHAVSPQYANDKATTDGFGRYLSRFAATAPGALAGPLAPGTPLMGFFARSVDPKRRSAKPDPKQSPEWKAYELAINTVFRNTPGLSDQLPGVPNFWGEEVFHAHGIAPDDVVPWQPARQTPKKFSTSLLEAAGFDPAEANALQVFGAKIGDGPDDWSVAKYKRFVKIMGVDGEFVRLMAPVGRHPSTISPQGRRGKVGVPVKLDQFQYIEYLQIMNLEVIDKKTGNMKQTLDDLVQTDIYIALPDQNNAPGSKASILSNTINKFRKAAAAIFFSRHKEIAGPSMNKLQEMLKPKTPPTGTTEPPSALGNVPMNEGFGGTAR